MEGGKKSMFDRALQFGIAGALAVSGAILSGSVLADNEYSSAQLARDCKLYEYATTPGNTPTHPEMMQAMTCVSYITGLRQAQALAEAVPDLPMHCAPRTVTSDQIARIYTKFMAARPQLLHGPASPNLHGALMEAFPCGKK